MRRSCRTCARLRNAHRDVRDERRRHRRGQERDSSSRACAWRLRSRRSTGRAEVVTSIARGRRSFGEWLHHLRDRLW
jgi:hypothetical protein